MYSIKVRKLDMITLTRFDLVATFCGQTRPKTLQALEEIYKIEKSVQIEGPIYYGGHDDFGLEALEAIQEFKRDHPYFVIVVTNENHKIDYVLQQYSN